MRINVAIPEPHVTAPILDAALEGVTRLNEALIKKGSVPTFRKAVNRVRWKPEPPGQEHFDHAGLVLNRGWGDCDDLAPWHAASLRATGQDPGATAIVKKSGHKRWHAVVRRSDGKIDDPSLAAGMPGPGRRVGINGAAVPVMFEPEADSVSGSYIARPQLALRPQRSRNGEVESWQARADLPWHWEPTTTSPTDIAMVSLHRSPVSSQAIVGACRGAVLLGEASGQSEDHIDRLSAIADGCDGASWEELAEEYGPDHATAAGTFINGFFGGLKRAVRKVATPRGLANMAMLPFGGRRVVQRIAPIAMPLAQKALPFVPGVGPAASLAFQYASPYLQRAIADRQHEPPPMRQQAPMPFYPPMPFEPPAGDPYGFASYAAQHYGAVPFR